MKHSILPFLIGAVVGAVVVWALSPNPWVTLSTFASDQPKYPDTRDSFSFFENRHDLYHWDSSTGVPSKEKNRLVWNEYFTVRTPGSDSAGVVLMRCDSIYHRALTAADFKSDSVWK